MEKNAKIYIAGHTGLVGTALVRRLREQGYHNLLLRTHEELDCTSQPDVLRLLESERPDYVIIAAGLVGGIRANAAAPADFFLVNASIANNIISAAFHTGVKKLLYLGSACMYPKECPQPMTEDMLLCGLPEVTNEGYALAKIGGSRLCSYLNRQYGVDFISTIPANAYGLNDCFDPEKSHVIPALIMKYHKAKQEKAEHVELWGSGRAMREFLYTDDLADGCLFLMEHYKQADPVNMGTGSEISMLELSKLIGRTAGYEGQIVCDATKPDGMMRRIVDSTRMNEMGWQAKVSLEEGIRRVYDWYLQQEMSAANDSSGRNRE